MIDKETFEKMFVPMAKRFKEKEAKHKGEWKTASLNHMRSRVRVMFNLWNFGEPLKEPKQLIDLANQSMLLYLRLTGRCEDDRRDRDSK